MKLEATSRSLSYIQISARSTHNSITSTTIMMTQSQSLFNVVALISLLLIATRFQYCTSEHPERPNNDFRIACNNKTSYYSSTYPSINQGLKVVDALRAQTQFIRNPHIGILDKFSPLLPGGNSRSYIATIKSVMEVIRMKERYQALDAMNSDPQPALAQLLLGKVAEESCLWLNESPDISITDCTNIDLSQLKELYRRMDLFETLENAFTDVRKVMHNANYHDIYTCAWMNHRVLDNCAVQNMNYGHRDTLNRLCNPALNDIRPPGCDPQLCPWMT